MDSTPSNTSFRRVELFASVEQVPVSHPLSLGWQVSSSNVAVSSIQLASASESGLEVIESVPDQGRRQMIFARPGRFTFTLIVIFQDGVRRSQQICVRVTG